MTPAPLDLSWLEIKALFVHCFATYEAPVAGMDEPLQTAFESGVQKLQNASHASFVPSEPVTLPPILWPSPRQ